MGLRHGRHGLRAARRSQRRVPIRKGQGVRRQERRGHRRDRDEGHAQGDHGPRSEGAVGRHDDSQGVSDHSARHRSNRRCARPSGGQGRRDHSGDDRQDRCGRPGRQVDPRGERHGTIGGVVRRRHGCRSTSTSVAGEMFEADRQDSDDGKRREVVTIKRGEERPEALAAADSTVAAPRPAGRSDGAKYAFRLVSVTPGRSTVTLISRHLPSCFLSSDGYARRYWWRRSSATCSKLRRAGRHWARTPPSLRWSRRAMK